MLRLRLIFCALLALVLSHTALAATDTGDRDAAVVAQRDLQDALSKRPRDPVIAVMALNEGTETTDFLVPYGVLKRAGIKHVQAVAVDDGDVTLMPALRIVPDTTFADFDARHPEGADIVIVPAMHSDNDPRVLHWLRQQASHGAMIVGICSGARVLSQAGLLKGRRFTGHWYDRSDLRDANPSARYVPDVRYLHDNGIVTTTGVSASVPLALALVEGIAGRDRALDVARSLGATDWSAQHVSAGFQLNARRLWTVASNTVSVWRHETLAIPVADGVDDIALALTADAWSRTWRTTVMATPASTHSADRVRLASGLTLVTMAPRPSAARPLALLPNRNAMTQFVQSLHDIEQRYGAAERDIVELAMEYVPPSR
ncbi:Isonitrile hydratase [Pandoraea iniqua]|uniref:Isonitrile hydratase n=1 Tax=Pandoraea iniqua TaxID=2508288 RepID=A0A5E4T0V7_9BURK|nr:DJ-1/PfpI family protein [Pandoraea iniqua]VVD80992.1 Isonitrile hydratase [Pandoraea iniqua]